MCVNLPNNSNLMKELSMPMHLNDIATLLIVIYKGRVNMLFVSDYSLCRFIIASIKGGEIIATHCRFWRLSVLLTAISF